MVEATESSACSMQLTPSFVAPHCTVRCSSASIVSISQGVAVPPLSIISTTSAPLEHAALATAVTLAASVRYACMALCMCTTTVLRWLPCPARKCLSTADRFSVTGPPIPARNAALTGATAATLRATPTFGTPLSSSASETASGPLASPSEGNGAMATSFPMHSGVS